MLGNGGERALELPYQAVWALVGVHTHGGKVSWAQCPTFLVGTRWCPVPRGRTSCVLRGGHLNAPFPVSITMIESEIHGESDEQSSKTSWAVFTGQGQIFMQAIRFRNCSQPEAEPGSAWQRKTPKYT